MLGNYYRCFCGEMKWIIGDGIIICIHCKKQYRIKGLLYPKFFNENNAILIDKDQKHNE